MSNNVLNKMYHRLRNRFELMEQIIQDEKLERKVKKLLTHLKKMGNDGRLTCVDDKWIDKVEEKYEELEEEWMEMVDYSDSYDLERCYGQNVYDYQEELYYDTSFEDGIGELIKNYNTLNGTKWVFTDGGVV